MEHEPDSRPAVLLVGPYDPTCGEYTFLAPPLGVWRLAGVLQAAGVRTRVFDPNCCDGPPEAALARELLGGAFDVCGFSTTGMTLRFDLGLAHLARRVSPAALLVAGGMEATFDPERMFQLGPFDLVVLGEGERPLKELVGRVRAGAPLEGIAGTAWRRADGVLERLTQVALSHDELRAAIFQTPYEEMPYPRYWKRLEEATRASRLPFKAEREARLAEIRSVRLITLNYCPMRCTFCSSTNFLNAAQGSTALIRRLDAEDCVAMVRRIVAAHPNVRTVIFQDDIFVFPNDARILPLCEALVEAKRLGTLPRDLQFISTNRIDAMRKDRLAAMRRAGFRVLGFGVESFSQRVLEEFGKAQIFPLIDGVLEEALALGITPFLDMILTSPRSARVQDLSFTLRRAFAFMQRGCEVGMYPYVVPFSGAALAGDPTLRPHTVFTARHVAGTGVTWAQATKIPPLDAELRGAILTIEKRFEERLAELEKVVPHLPSRVRSLVWVLTAVPVLRAAGEEMPPLSDVVHQLLGCLPGLSSATLARLERRLSAPDREARVRAAIGAEAAAPTG